MNGELKEELLKFCDDGIAETQEWMKYGIEKLQRHNPDKTFE